MEISHKLPEIFAKDKKKEYISNMLNKHVETSIVSSKTMLGQVNRTNLNQNKKNGDVDSLDDSSLSSLSSLSSDDENDEVNIDDFLNVGSTSDYNQKKRRGLDLDTAFSFAEIENLLSPLSVSPCPVSPLSSRSGSPVSPRPAFPLSPHPVPLLPLQAVSELPSSPPSARSPVSSLAGVDSNDEGDTTVDCLFTSEFASSQSQPAPHGDNREKIYASNNSNMNSVKAGAIKHVESVFRDKGYQNVIVSRSQSVGFTPVINDAGDICKLDVSDDSISDGLSGVANLADVNISKDVSDALLVTGSHMLENVSNNATLVARSDLEYSSNNTHVMDHSISENICNVTMSTDTSVTDNVSDMDTCVEIYIFKNVPSAGLDKFSSQTEVAETCDNKSVINITQASDTESVLPQMNQTIHTRALDLRSLLSQTHQTLDIVSLDLKSPPLVTQTHTFLDAHSLDLKSSDVFQTPRSSDTISLELKSPALFQTPRSSDTLSLDLKSSDVFQAPRSSDTLSLELKSPALFQAPTSSDTLSLELKSPALFQAPTSSDTISLELKSPALFQAPTSSDTISLELKSPALFQTPTSSDTLSLDLKSPALFQAPTSSDTISLDLKSPALFQAPTSSDTISLELKSPALFQAPTSSDTLSLELKSSDVFQTPTSSDTLSLELKSSDVFQAPRSSDTLSLELKSPALFQTPTSSDTLSLKLKSPALFQTPTSSDTLSLELKSPALFQTPTSSDTLSLELKSPALPQTHQLINTQILDPKSSSSLFTNQQSLNAQMLDLTSSYSLPQTQQSVNTQILSLDLPKTQSTISTNASNIKSSSVLLEKQQSSNIETLESKPLLTLSPNHLSLNIKASNVMSSSSLPPKDQSLNSQPSIIKSSLSLLQKDQSLNTQAFKASSSSAVLQILKPLTSESSNITLPTPLPTKNQSLNTQTSNVRTSDVSQIHQSLDTKASDIKSLSTVPQMHRSLNMKDPEITSSLVVPEMHQSLIIQPEMHQSVNTQTSGIKSSAVPQIHPPLNTQTSDIKSSAVPQIHPPLNTQTSDIKSLVVSQIHPPLNTQTSDIKSSAVPQIHPPLNTQTSDIKSLVVPQIHPPLNTQTSDIKSLVVPQIHPPLNTQTSDIKSSAVPQIHPPLNMQDADIMSSPAMSQMHQSLDTASDTKSSSVLPQKHQVLLLDVFNFFSLPPLLSPLPSSPRPHQLQEDLPLVRFNSAAPANLQKVTPLAQVERKAAAGNSSMSSQIIEAKKLMAKRKAAILVQPVAVTNGDKRKRTMIVAEISPAVPTKRRKLANLSGFPNANAAIMYDLRQFLTAKDLDLKKAAETMLSRVVEGNTKAVWEMLCQVTVNYLQSTHQDELIHLISACEKEGIIDTVFIREDERRLVLLISAFWRLDENLDRRLLMGMIWTAIFNRGCRNELVRLSFCRIFTSLCLEQGDLEQVRILMYSIAWCDYLDLAHPLMAIVGVWPQVLDHSYKLNKCCIKNVLRFMLREKCKADSSLLHKVKLVLQRVCQFDLGKTHESPEKLLKNLVQLMECQVLDGINNSKLEQTFETMKTIELLLVYQGPEWTEKHFIMSSLVSFTMRWENKRLDKTIPPDQFITCLLRIFRAVIAVQSPSVSAVGTVLGTVFPRFLNSTTGDAGMMATCIDALLDLAPFSPEKCLDMLNKWKATQSNIPAETLSKLQQVQSMLSQKAPPKKQCKRGKQKKRK